MYIANAKHSIMEILTGNVVKQRSGNECKVELVFDESKNILNQSGDHFHPQNPDQVQAEITRSRIK